MGKHKVEQKIVQIAHEFVQKFGEDVLQLTPDELIAYLTSYFDYESWLIFKHNEYELLKLFIQTIKEDLESQNK